jgi:hypothetical protein
VTPADVFALPAALDAPWLCRLAAGAGLADAQIALAKRFGWPDAEPYLRRAASQGGSRAQFALFLRDPSQTDLLEAAAAQENPDALFEQGVRAEDFATSVAFFERAQMLGKPEAGARLFQIIDALPQQAAAEQARFWLHGNPMRALACYRRAFRILGSTD